MIAQNVSPDQATGALVLLVIAALSSVTTIIVAILNTRHVKSTRQEFRDAIDTENGHTIGQGMARVERLTVQTARRMDTVELMAREARDAATITRDDLQAHIEEVREDREFLQSLKPQKGEEP